MTHASTLERRLARSPGRLVPIRVKRPPQLSVPNPEPAPPPIPPVPGEPKPGPPGDPLPTPPTPVPPVDPKPFPPEPPVVDGTTPAADTDPTFAHAQRQLDVLQWVVPALTGALLVLNAYQGEQQRPTVVARGLVKRVIGS